MNPAIRNEFVQQLNDLLHKWRLLKPHIRDGEYNGISESDVTSLLTRSLAAIDRIAPSGSPYRKQANNYSINAVAEEHYKLQLVIGVLQSLSDDIRAGYLATAEELIHASMFADFLEMAEHLRGEGYYGAAAVITGSSLEAHLRNLCTKNSIALSNTSGGPKGAGAMNNELGSTKHNTLIDQQAVTAWLALRNKAAHGEYDKVTNAQVELMIGGVRDFIARNPA